MAVRDPSESVSFRAAQSEAFRSFDEEWQTRGFANRSQALQALVRARCGLLDVMRKDVNTFAEALLCAQDVAQSGRLLAKAVQRGKLSLEGEDRATLLSLLDLAQEIQPGHWPRFMRRPGHAAGTGGRSRANGLSERECGCWLGRDVIHV